MPSLVSAVLGGIVGAALVLYLGGNTHKNPDSFDKLKVKELVVSEKFLLWKDGKDDADLLIQDGGILARTKVIATQVCGNAILGNYVYTTPDDFIKKPLGQCAIYTEMASRADQGGIFTVRSAKGPNTLDPNGIKSGLAYTVAFDGNEVPLCVIRKNATMENMLMFDPKPFMAGGLAGASAPGGQPQHAPAPNTSASGPSQTSDAVQNNVTQNNAANQPGFPQQSGNAPMSAQVPGGVPR